MFGERRRLQRTGTPAQAVVTALRRLSGGDGHSALTYELTLNVHYGDGTKAEALCRIGGNVREAGLWFSVGDIVPVRHDPSDRAKVVIDAQELRTQQETRMRALQQAAIERAERHLAGLPDANELPTDEQLAAAHRAWRTSVTRHKAAKAEHTRAQKDGDRSEVLRLATRSATRAAEERSARDKYHELLRLRPTWTPADDA